MNYPRTESELKQYLKDLNKRFNSIPNRLYVVWLMAEIRKVESLLAERKLLEYKGERESS